MLYREFNSEYLLWVLSRRRHCDVIYKHWIGLWHRCHSKHPVSLKELRSVFIYCGQKVLAKMSFTPRCVQCTLKSVLRNQQYTFGVKSLLVVRWSRKCCWWGTTWPHRVVSTTIAAVDSLILLGRSYHPICCCKYQSRSEISWVDNRRSATHAVIIWRPFFCDGCVEQATVTPPSHAVCWHF